MLRDILSGDDPQVLAVSNVIRAANADVLILSGIDYDLQRHALNAFARHLQEYDHLVARAPNRGLPTSMDLDGDGRLGGPGDAQGYGRFWGQGGLVVLSRIPVVPAHIQDFSALVWPELPMNIAPEKTWPGQRLSTNLHLAVEFDPPGDEPFSVLLWHATPPVFDGPEDRNGRRNHDETAFWLRYLEGRFGPIPERFVLAGIANLDVYDGEGRPEALSNLLNHPSLLDPRPSSNWGREAAALDGGVNGRHLGDPALDTVDWDDQEGRPGNMRVSYVLPSRTFEVVGSGIIWPDPETSLGRDVIEASRHRLVWVDVCVQRCRNGS
ncbi:MAG: endonuclease/exonuclease/phosphatase family protein [Boseongicola sp.]|nr:endonuclease/exonuclease/phosphatase family protein [Boseongicola sp.]